MSSANVPRRTHPIYFHESAGAVVMIDGRCLVLRRADRGQWVFPKGHVEAGERAEDAAVREVREETGYEVEVGQNVLRSRLIQEEALAEDRLEPQCAAHGSGQEPGHPLSALALGRLERVAR
jgi:8-oxo-dGTP pyrophosphatase MutT (NUDIX family)